MKKHSITLMLSVLILILFITAGCGNGNVVARVNGEKILQADLQDKIAEIKLGLTNQGIDVDQEQNQEMLSQIQKEALNQLMDEALLMQQASKMGIKVDNKEIQDQLQQLKDQFGEDTFKQLLAQQKLTEAKLSKQIKVQMTAQALFEKVTDDIKVDEKTAKEYFEKNKADLEERKVAHILISADETATEEQVNKAKKTAEDLIGKLKAGEDFAKLAKESSEDLQSGANGGVIDQYFNRNDTNLVPEFVAGAFQLKGEGDFSQQPVRSSYGFHIIKVLDSKSTYEELKKSLNNIMMSDKKNDAFVKFFNKAKSEAKIENLMEK